jgi:hypothetical protein
MLISNRIFKYTFIQAFTWNLNGYMNASAWIRVARSKRLEIFDSSLRYLIFFQISAIIDVTKEGGALSKMLNLTNRWHPH